MWELVKAATSGMLSGKMFSNPGFTYGMAVIGVAATAGLCFGAWSLGAPLPLAAGSAAFLGGVLQPRLFKNIKLA